MSTMEIADSDRFWKATTHRRNDSGELDVFEAARYFSGLAEAAGFTGGSQKTMKEERPTWVGGRKSVDMPMRHPIPSSSHRVEKFQHIKEKKSKQPSSPGGRLASFLNSLFSQTGSKKKSKSSTQSMKDEEDSPGGRRKRRSSISHFQGIGRTESKSVYSSSRSGFRTPPYSHTPSKVYKDLISYSDKKSSVPLSKCNGQARPVTLHPQYEVLNEKKQMNFSWLEDKFRFNDGFVEKNKIRNVLLEKNGIMDKERRCSKDFVQKERPLVDKFASEDKNFMRLEKDEDGAESDSSSDLFELQNYDLGVYSTGLPVYETTHMESIKRGSPIVSGTH